MDGIEGGSIVGSEDCLYLNIYLSEKAYNSKEKLPVMFWIQEEGIRGVIQLQICLLQGIS